MKQVIYQLTKPWSPLLLGIASLGWRPPLRASLRDATPPSWNQHGRKFHKFHNIAWRRFHQFANIAWKKETEISAAWAIYSV